MPADLQAAFDRFEQGDHEGALPTLAKYAEAGRPAAQSALGLLYATGRAVERDPVLAVDLFRQSALQEDPNGQFYLGFAYLAGAGVKTDQNEALAWFI